MSDQETIQVDAHTLSLAKAHLLVDILPNMVDLPNYQESQEFREGVLSEWIAQAIEEKLKRDGFLRITKDEKLRRENLKSIESPDGEVAIAL